MEIVGTILSSVILLNLINGSASLSSSLTNGFNFSPGNGYSSTGSSYSSSIYTYNKYDMIKNNQHQRNNVNLSPSLILRNVFSSQNVESGSSISLKCTAAGHPLPQITWTLDESSIHESNSRISVGDFVTRNSEVISYVNITNIHIEDGGTYACSAVNEVANNVHSGRINVIGAPLIKNMSPKVGIESSNIVLNCPYSGYPIDDIYWEHNSRRIPYNHRQKSYPNGTIVIETLDKRTDGGEYKCIVKGSGQTVTKSVKISIQSAPIIEPFSFPKFLEEGSRAKILCNVIKGDPPITIRWLKDGKLLPGSSFSGTSINLPPNSLPALTSSSSNGATSIYTTSSSTSPSSLNGISISTLDEFSSAIILSKVSLAHHRGNYTCIASNSVSSTNYTAEALVHAHPRWIIEPLNTIAVTSRDVMIHCSAEGWPEPIIEWRRQPNPNNPNNNNKHSHSPVITSVPNFKTINYIDGRLHKLENGSLEIKHVDKSDEGNYMCKASNGIGGGISTVVSLTVRTPAHFKEEFKVETVTKSVPLVIKCEAFGDKPLTIKWKKDGQPFLSGSLNHDKRYVFSEVITEHGLTAQVKVDSSDRRDSSLYTCLTSNNYGSDEINLQVIVQEKPDAPSKASISKVESRSVSIQWSPPYSGNSPILYYILEFKEVTDEDWSSARALRIPGSETRALVTGLWPGTSYHFRISAENSLGKSEPGSMIHAMTELEVPSDAPTDVKAEAVGSRAIRVTWKCGSTSPRLRSQIKGYYIGFKTIHGNGHGSDGGIFTYKTMEIVDSKNGHQTAFDTIISGLERLTKYVVIVKAFNRKGSGPPSNEIYVKTNDLDIPSPPELDLVSTSHKSIEIKWEVSDPRSVTGFTLYKREESSSWEEISLVSDVRTYQFRDLSCGTKYQIYILSYNEAGTGLPSNTVSTRTHGTVPIAPSQSTFLKLLNSSTISLNFNEWQSGGCFIKYFMVTFKLESSSQWSSLTSPISGDTNKYVIGDLMTDSWYRLKVSAVNDAGSTEAEYTFSTSAGSSNILSHLGIQGTVDGSTINSDESTVWFGIVLLPISTTLIILVCIGFVLYNFKRKQNSFNGHLHIGHGHHLRHPSLRGDGSVSMKESMYGIMTSGGGSSILGTSTFGVGGASAASCMEQMQMSELNSLKAAAAASNNRNGNNMGFEGNSIAGHGTMVGTLSTPKEYLYFPSSCQELEAINCANNSMTLGQESQYQQQQHRVSTSEDQLMEKQNANCDGSNEPLQYGASSGHPVNQGHITSCPGQFRVSGASGSATRDRTYEVPFILTKDKMMSRFPSNAEDEHTYSYPARQLIAQQQQSHNGSGNVVVRFWPKDGPSSSSSSKKMDEEGINDRGAGDYRSIPSMKQHELKVTKYQCKPLRCASSEIGIMENRRQRRNDQKGDDNDGHVGNDDENYIGDGTNQTIETTPQQQLEHYYLGQLEQQNQKHIVSHKNNLPY